MRRCPNLQLDLGSTPECEQHIQKKMFRTWVGQTGWGMIVERYPHPFNVYPILVDPNSHACLNVSARSTWLTSGHPGVVAQDLELAAAEGDMERAEDTENK